jgi:hypothetical protein
MRPVGLERNIKKESEMDWLYLYLRFDDLRDEEGEIIDRAKYGRLVDEQGDEANPNWPGFLNYQDAEDFLEEYDIRATIM